jgi:hypothetical protein
MRGVQRVALWFFPLGLYAFISALSSGPPLSIQGSEAQKSIQEDRVLQCVLQESKHLLQFSGCLSVAQEWLGAAAVRPLSVSSLTRASRPRGFWHPHRGILLQGGGPLFWSHGGVRGGISIGTSGDGYIVSHGVH